MLALVQGPAGSGKTQHVLTMRDAGEIDLISDVTSLWVALTGVTRGPDGRYPVRRHDDPALGASLYLQTVAVGYGLREGLRVGVTTSRRGQESRWRTIAEDNNVPFSVFTIDPGETIVRQRLAEPDGNLSQDCQIAIAKWYGTA